jgi:3-hydroxybutyryl-CoA dehydrogenase
MTIKNVAVIGAGVMGRGIAHSCALGGFDVTLTDVSMDILDKALAEIRQNLHKGIDRGKLTLQQKEAALTRLSCLTDLAAAASNADLVIEAVTEDLTLKQDLFNQLDQMCPAHTCLASNTSAMSITEISAMTARPDKVIGLHFFNPVHIMKLVEIVSGLETSPTTVDICEAACRHMGKETVRINEYPGFVTSRINALIGNEAFHMLQEGLASPEDIDRAIKLGLNHPMGPFEMIDLVGLDTRLNILNYLHDTLGEKYRPAPLLVKYVKAGRLGRKTGKGIYEYDKP